MDGGRREGENTVGGKGVGMARVLAIIWEERGTKGRQEGGKGGSSEEGRGSGAEYGWHERGRSKGKHREGP